MVQREVTVVFQELKVIGVHLWGGDFNSCFDLIILPELARVEEEAPPAAHPAPEPQAPTQPLPPVQPIRAEEPERPAERADRQSPPEPRLEPIKPPLHVPMSNSMLESIPMAHIATTRTGGLLLIDALPT